jgi:hypothetical protein
MFWGLTDPISRKRKFVQTIVRPYYHLQYVELSEVHQCMIYGGGFVDSNWSSLKVWMCLIVWKHTKRLYKSYSDELNDIYTCWRWWYDDTVWRLFLYNCALPGDGPLSPETYRNLGILNIILVLANSMKLIGSHWNNNIVCMLFVLLV